MPAEGCTPPCTSFSLLRWSDRSCQSGYNVAEMKIGLSLGSGGARGYAHIGVLQVLERAGIKVDLINGSSIGAIVGGAYALYHDSKRLVSLATEVVSRAHVNYYSIFQHAQPDRHPHLRDWLLSALCDFTALRTSVFSHRTNRTALSYLFGEYRFSDTAIPFSAVAVDLITGKPVVIREGRLRDGILPSISIPGVFPPVEWDGMLLTDGGVLADVPVRELRAEGAEFVIAVRLAGEPPAPYKNGFDLLTTVDYLKGKRLSDWEVEMADFLIEIELPGYDPMRFDDSRTAIERGIRTAEAALPGLLRKLEERDA